MVGAEKSLVNIDLQPIADVGNNLINKISDAVGWAFTRNTLKKEALQVLKIEIENSNLPPVAKAALISNANKIMKEYVNTHNILQIAVDNLETNNKAEEVDDDWLMQFIEMVKNVSNQDFQMLWGKLLANECNNPGCIPKSVLFILQKMDKEDAESFMKISSLVVNIGGEYAPLVFNEFYDVDRNNPYSQLELSYDDLCQLDALGLIKMENATFGGGIIYDVSKDSDYKYEIRYFDKVMKIKRDNRTVEGGTVLLTKDGRALYKAIEPHKIDCFWENIVLKHYSNVKE